MFNLGQKLFAFGKILVNVNKTVSIARFSSENSSSALRSRKKKSVNPMVQYYVDRCLVRALGGKGGDGCISFLSAWSNENAGPNGGDGGNGGHVVFTATDNVKNLNHCHVIAEGKHGEKGGTKDCHGKNAEHHIIKVPIGTIVKDKSSKIVADLDKEGMMFVAARGGAGGKGNAFFKTDIEQAPEIAEYGAMGEKIEYSLEVKSMAHVGLLGIPNAGKSTLLQAITRARPKIAPYPFTTLHPHIGIVQYKDYEQVAVADLPGLIAGSHKNHGLGIQFLQHAERCCCLVFVVDVSLDKPWEQIETLLYELSQFDEDLAERPQLVIANKIDLPEAKSNLPLLKSHFEHLEIIPVSAKMGTNLSKLLEFIKDIYDKSMRK